MKKNAGIHIALISLHGLVRGNDPELGRDEDTGGQIRYVLELARALAEDDRVARVDLITRQIVDDRVSKDYAQLTEPIAEKASIIRIPFGPKRYLSKTTLWPYMDVFVDQCLHHFRSNQSVPDIIHGHYADAGYGGGQLARLLGVPFVFTGHSLGRVKKQRLAKSGVSFEKIESKYNISQRIEAEEFALETCSLICTSTHQEVHEQYELYQNYIPERMEVIPPGVDLSAFYPPGQDKESTALETSINSFLHDTSKPLIVAIARPDERKNLEKLVKVYGESRQLQREANLVLIMGSRDDIREMPSGQKKVLSRILTLIDVYDLYGKVAYPKKHQPDEVPALYRMITKSRGIFINPALTEPFGLTLLEAAASGCPIVATNDGGPSDIIANCQNGVLVDPLDQKAIEKALLRGLTEPEEWKAWSESGIKNVHAYYSWQHHTEHYLRNIQELLESTTATSIVNVSGKKRPLQKFDRLIITDVDNTLTGDDEAMKKFFDLIQQSDETVGFGIATGRCYEDVLKLISDYDMPSPEVLITSTGTEIYYGDNLTLDNSWRKHINYRWEPERIRKFMKTVEGVFEQEAKEQSNFKISYKVDFSVAPKLSAIRRSLRKKGIRAKVILSLNMFLDIIPVRAGSGICIRHLAYKWDFPLENILIAGDSGNDKGMLAGNTLGVVVGNYSVELEKLHKYPRVYFAEAHHAAGIIEGIEYYDFLGAINIPNEGSVKSNG
jgi:sucrose-phosphate synthase